MSFDLALKKVGSIGFFYSPELFSKEKILVVFSLRQGGVSPEPYDSLNLGFHVGDKKENVLLNRQLMLSRFNLDISQLTTAEQVHGHKCVVVDGEFVGKGATSHEDSISGTDALISNLERVPLALFFADCVPVVIVDPAKRVIAVIHAGWKGILQGIVSRVIAEIRQNLNSAVPDLLAYIGPCIGKCCYEVDETLRERFENKYDVKFDGTHIDLSLFVQKELRKEGVLEDRVFCADLCTRCRHDMFYSFRKAEITGRHAALATLLDDNFKLPFIP